MASDGSTPGTLTRAHEKVHRAFIFERRKAQLISSMNALLPAQARVLDVGCGNGEVGAGMVAEGHEVYGVEVLDRESCEIEYELYDGKTLPFEDGAFEWATINDVLHHCDNPAEVMAEALRVCPKGLVIKDHYNENKLDEITLGAMDWVGNQQFGVGRYGAYLSRQQWADTWSELGLEVAEINEEIGLYPAPLSWVFERGLHFVARLEPIQKSV